MTVRVVQKARGSERIVVNRAYCGKVMTLRRGYRCSLHYHRHKDETFLVTKGRILLEIDGERRFLLPGDVVDVPPGSVHRFTGMVESEFIEFSSHDDPGDSHRSSESGEVPRDEWLVLHRLESSK